MTDPNVGLMAHTVSTPASRHRLLTLQSCRQILEDRSRLIGVTRARRSNVGGILDRSFEEVRRK